MNKTGKRPRPSLLLLLLLMCAMVISACGKSGPAVRPEYCPKPSNVMRSPKAVQSLRALLFESDETQTTSFEHAKR